MNKGAYILLLLTKNNLWKIQVQSQFYDANFELNFFNIPSKMILRIGLTILKKLKLNIFMTVNTFKRDLYKNGQK
jgi:hypothetical protein